MKCGDKYIQHFPQKYISGIKHFLQEKSVFTTVHPIWVLVLTFISSYITDSHMERFLLVTFAFYSVLFEMTNSSIESTNDRWGCQYNHDTKVAKELTASVTALSRLPLFVLCFMIIYRNIKSCNTIMACG